MSLRDYGLSLGTAFQLIDDLLDFTSSEEALGKAAGADLLGGKVTLPLIYLRDRDPQAREMVQTVLRETKYGSVKEQDVLEAIVRSGALEQARAKANEYAEDARTALDALPDSEYSESLRALPTYILDRDR